MSFIDVIVINIHPFENFVTVLALVLLGRSVFALDMFVDVGALVAPVITDQAPPIFSSDILHSFAGLVFRIYKLVAISAEVRYVDLVAVTLHATMGGEGFLTDITGDLKTVAVFMFGHLPPRLEDLITEITGEGGVQVLPLCVLVETDLMFVRLTTMLTREARLGSGVLPLDMISQGLQPSGCVVAVFTKEGSLSVALRVFRQITFSSELFTTSITYKRLGHWFLDA